MNIITRKSIAREGILFLVFLTGIFFWMTGSSYISSAIAQQESQGLVIGGIFISMPTANTALNLGEEKNAALMRACLFQKIGIYLLFSYLLYLVARGLFLMFKNTKTKHLNRRMLEGGRNMNRWVKNNWFRLGILAAFFIMSFSVAYYFILFLPKQQQGTELIAKSVQSVSELENRCFEASKEFFREKGFNDRNSGFLNHYNKTLNKCFITIKSAKMSDDGHLNFYKALYDVYGRKMYGEYSWKREENKNYWEIKPSACSILDKPCQSTEEYDSFVKKYMEE